MFKNKSSQNGKTAKSSDSMAKHSRSLLHIFADERERWLSILDQVEPRETHQPEKSSVLLTWIEEQLEAAQSHAEPDESDLKRPISVEAVSAPAADSGEVTSKALPVIDNLASSIAFLTAEVGGRHRLWNFGPLLLYPSLDIASKDFLGTERDKLVIFLGPNKDVKAENQLD